MNLVVAHEEDLVEYADTVYLVEKTGTTATVRRIKDQNEERN